MALLFSSIVASGNQLFHASIPRREWKTPLEAQQRGGGPPRQTTELRRLIPAATTAGDGVGHCAGELGKSKASRT
jgi:hypothetical protein